MGDTNQTDFNDLHVAEGLEVVREQILAAVSNASVLRRVDNETPANSPAPTLDDAPLYGDDSASVAEDLPPAPSHVAPLSIEQVKTRFALALPSGKVWDAHEQKLLKPSVAKGLMGKKFYTEWFDSDDKRTVQENDVQRKAAAADAKGGGELSQIMQRYVYLYPTDGVWDNQRREIVPVSSLKLAIAKYYDEWLKSPERLQIDREKLVFDPTQRCDPDTHINMFRGLAIKPEGDESGCEAVIQLILNLCNHDMEVFSWLVKWLAFPLQNIGAKMATAIMMHSETQGTGKSLVFGGYMTRIYGEYAATLGQHQLESQYTDWRSQKLYGLFEEIFSRDQKYSHTGTIKHMVTGETQRIEKKFVSGWEEANHMNAVFLSNEIQPFHVEASDRRMLVIWPQRTPPVALVEQAVDELNNGGAAAFYNWLLQQPLDDFGPHTKPPMTEAKERLIDFGRPGWDTFYREWERGSLEVPYVSCLTRDLYAFYKRWCGQAGERDMSLNKFTGFVGSRLRVRRDLHYAVGSGRKKGNFFIVGKPGEGQSQGLWLGKCVEEFTKALTEYENQRGGVA